MFGAQVPYQGTAHPLPEITGQRTDFTGDQTIAFDGHFHRIGGLGPEVWFVHSGIPFND